MKKSGVMLTLLVISTLLISLSIVGAESNETETNEIESEEVICADDTKECWDGSFVNRNPENNCEFDSCPEEICPSIIGWRIENNKCLADTGCDYDSSIYTYYNSEEECGKHLIVAECGEDVGCASERKEYCDNSNACFSETVYECIDGKCVASETSTGGCTQCPDECKDGYCLTAPEPRPEPKPRPDICAARISINFNKNVYYVGDEFKAVIEVFDSQGNPLPHYPFYIKVYDYDKGMWHPSFEEDRTDGSGYKIHQDKMSMGEPFRFGKNKFKIFTQASGCSLVEEIVIIEVKRKEGPKPVPCGMGSCVPEEEAEEVEAIPEERGFYSCQGCEADEKCYPMGYRKSGQFCSEDYEFVSQRSEGVCDNNFECSSNVCVSGECVSEGLMKKILGWFKKMFGGGEDEDDTGQEMCSDFLIEEDIGEYKYIKSGYGEDKNTRVPVYTKNGENIETIKCCLAQYTDSENKEHATMFCPYDSEEDVTNSVKWIIAKERNIIFKEYENQKVFGDEKGQIIAWTHNSYLVVVGIGPLNERDLSLPKEIANAYLGKYPSEFKLTEEDIPDAPPERPWEYCTEEDEKKGNKCESQAGRLQTDPHPENKNCEVYKGCILPYEKCERIKDVDERNGCYVDVARMTGDSSVCEKITSDESRRNKCYVKAAEFTRDAGVCEKITNEEIKKMCFELAEVFPWEVCTSENDMLNEECHFTDDFESGLGNWVFSDARGETNTDWWTIVAENDNTVFKGIDHNWAVFKGKEWDNYLFKFRFKKIEGAIHFNFRRGEGPFSRYFIGVGENLYLNKQIDKNFYDLVDKKLTLDQGWHTMEIKGYDNVLNIYIDNKLLIKYKDTEDQLFSGGIAFETLDNSEFLIDDVEVKLITADDVIYP